jgi:hypothetical protein
VDGQEHKLANLVFSIRKKRIAEKNNEREFFKLPGLGIEPGTKRFFVYTPLPLSLSHSAARSVVNFYSVTIVRE